MNNVHIQFIMHSLSGTIHATMLNATDRQTISLQRGYFCAITGVGRDAVLGAVEVAPSIAAALGFIVSLAKGDVAV
ncbi:hypothetical protein [Paenibacillus qinlingensis]|uniref:hypothetical protein n=1 Tax=Paenibacillus qinlingensis TaxID=1837343 RepID=UPI001564BF75|nr:hypothetical protein [Paenibacillus qinlingensis]NQX61828.1 hypothetical protein [Paenibacillus qinlingensis]